MSCSSTLCITNTSYPIYDGSYSNNGTYDGYPSWSGSSNGYYIFFHTGTTQWCLADTLGGCCLLAGKSPCTSSCPDLYDAYLSTGSCPTPTPTPTNNCSVLDFESYFNCDSVSYITPTPTQTTTSTPTPTPTPTFICGSFNVEVDIFDIPLTPTPTSSLTPTPTPTSPPRDISFSGDVTFNTVNTNINCPISKEFGDCNNPNIIYSTTQLVTNPSGGQISEYMVFNAMVDGSPVCLYYIGTSYETIGGNSIKLENGPLGYYNSGGCAACVPTQTPTQTPTKTPIPSLTPTQTATPTYTPSHTPTVTPSSPLPPIDSFVKCGEIFCESGQVNFGPEDNIDNIFNTWYRFCSFALNKYVDRDDVVKITGLQPNGTIITNNSSYYFYTGATNTRYLGAFNLPMTEGENIGPVAASASNLDKFYYNTNINKFVISIYASGANPPLWSTFNPTTNLGITLGNPSASQFLTTSSNWNTTDLTNVQYTVSGASNVVVSAIRKMTDAGGLPKMIQCANNSGLVNGFYSLCEYGNYVHEVTLGSMYSDDDFIGLVLTSKKGLGTNPDATDMLTLMFNGFGNSVNVVYNLGQDAYAFNNGTGIGSSVIMTGATNPFGLGDYNTKGQIRLKVVKTNTTITIYTTQRMGPAGLVAEGSSNPYTLLYQFDLTNKATWNSAPSYAIGTELLKFTGATSFGYFTSSQKLTQFYDIAFSSIQEPTSIKYSNTVLNPTFGKTYTFNSVVGCWKYNGKSTMYTQIDVESLTVNTQYNSCNECLNP